MADIKLGELITTAAERDAIHVAIAPVTAAERLAPGDHVGFVAGRRVSRLAENLIGVVDPFLKTAILPGEQCWLLLYQNSVTSLRHNWTHPSFELPAFERASWIRDAEEQCSC